MRKLLSIIMISITALPSCNSADVLVNPGTCAEGLSEGAAVRGVFDLIIFSDRRVVLAQRDCPQRLGILSSNHVDAALAPYREMMRKDTDILAISLRVRAAGVIERDAATNLVLRSDKFEIDTAARPQLTRFTPH